MKKRSINANYVFIKQKPRIILQDTNNQFMKVICINVQLVVMKDPVKIVYLNIFSQDTKERKMCVLFVIKNTRVHQVLEDTVDLCIKGKDTIVTFVNIQQQ